MTRKLSAILFVALALCVPLPAQQILGFTPASAAHQAEIEKTFKSIPSSDEARRQHRVFTQEPHIAGSKRNNELAEYIRDEWKKQGLEDVVIHRYDVYGTNPKSAELEMIAPTSYKALLKESPLPGDEDSKNPAISRAWLGMSISGEVTAPVIYAHSGNPEDYDLLRKHGISVQGKIVLVRYSNPYSYRGFKALTAQREGAAAMLVYSDPQEDGYKKGKVDPDGPWGPEYHIQRGAITYDFMVPGDPQTPGWASVPGAKRIPIEEAVSAPKIMALPLSWHDAKPFLENMDGPAAPLDWQGGLPFQYHLGGGRVKAHLKIEMDNGLQPYYVVEGRIRGSELPDEWVVMGNHRDAWVFGGVDPSSGTARKSVSPVPPNGESNSPTNFAKRPSLTSTWTKLHRAPISTDKLSPRLLRCSKKLRGVCRTRQARASTTHGKPQSSARRQARNPRSSPTLELPEKLSPILASAAAPTTPSFSTSSACR